MVVLIKDTFEGRETRPFLMQDIDNITHPVILFDGMCNLCSNVVQFVIKRDQDNVFRFSSLQSSFGHQLMKKHRLSEENYASFILYKDKKIYNKSTAALMVARQLKGMWPTLYVFILVPKFIRDFIYKVIAKNRYKWFGRKESCYIPSEKEKIKFF